MPEQMVIGWEFLPGFDKELIKGIREKYRAQFRGPSSPFMLQSWKTDGLTINVFAKKLVVQGVLDEHSKVLIQEIAGIEGLRLDAKNQEILARVFPIRQNAIVCSQCRMPSLLIEGEIAGLDVVFKKECGHVDKMRPPFLTLNNRILPDINVLISKTLSRFINLGYFHGFEIVVPQYVIGVVDQYVGRAQ